MFHASHPQLAPGLTEASYELTKTERCRGQPSKSIEVISSSENKQITAWGDARNKADHGKFGEISYAEVLTRVIGVRAFIDKHLP